MCFELNAYKKLEQLIIVQQYYVLHLLFQVFVV